MKNDTLTFGLIDSLSGEERPIKLEIQKGHDVKVTFPNGNISIESQQLAEVGSLLIRLADNTYDADSIAELLEGYGLLKTVPDTVNGLSASIVRALPMVPTPFYVSEASVDCIVVTSDEESEYKIQVTKLG